MPQSDEQKVAWVLGGGGLRGATEVGMAKALVAHGSQPDLIVGTSIGSLNGAVLASGPVTESVHRLTMMWEQMHAGSIFSESLFSRVRHLIDHWTHFHSNDPLMRLVEEWVPYSKLEEAYVDIETCAACIETSAEHWFTTGSVVDAVLASCALPGVLPPVKVGDQHFIDGGVVNSIPVSRAIDEGASEIYVLHVGHINDPLDLPRHPWDVAMVSFEIARRHRFHRELETAGQDVAVHVLPTGRPPGKFNDWAKLRYNYDKAIRTQMDVAEAASSRFLAEIGSGR